MLARDSHFASRVRDQLRLDAAPNFRAGFLEIVTEQKANFQCPRGIKPENPKQHVDVLFGKGQRADVEVPRDSMFENQPVDQFAISKVPGNEGVQVLPRLRENSDNPICILRVQQKSCSIPPLQPVLLPLDMEPRNGRSGRAPRFIFQCCQG